MKKLIISLKTTTDAMNDLKKRLKEAKKKKGLVDTHYEISFTEKKDFDHFVKNIDVLRAIQVFRPKSIYDLARLLQKDTANLNRLINFFDSVGAISVKMQESDGRMQKRPIVNYSKIEFDLCA